MRYEFQMIQTVVVDSETVNVSSEEQARELLEQGFASPSYWQGCEIRLVHVGYSEHHKMIDCPNHEGGYDCTPFCKICEGEQGYYPKEKK